MKTKKMTLFAHDVEVYICNAGGTPTLMQVNTNDSVAGTVQDGRRLGKIV
jgi:hypothetical protein